jgi:hypothetical protein
VDKLSGSLSNGNTVIKINDLSPNRRDAINASAATATYVTNAINTSLPAISFAGGTTTTDNYKISNTLYPAQITIACIVQLSSTSKGTFYSGPTNSLGLWFTTHFGMDNVQNAAVFTSSATLTTSTWYKIVITYNAVSGAWVARFNGAADSSGTNAQNIGAAESQIGYNQGAVAEPFNGKIAEFIVYDRVLSGGEITTLESYLNSKYGI